MRQDGASWHKTEQGSPLTDKVEIGENVYEKSPRVPFNLAHRWDGLPIHGKNTRKAFFPTLSSPNYGWLDTNEERDRLVPCMCCFDSKKKVFIAVREKTIDVRVETLYQS